MRGWTAADLCRLSTFVCSGGWGLWPFLADAFSVPRTPTTIRAAAVALAATDGHVAAAWARAKAGCPPHTPGVTRVWHPSEVALLLEHLVWGGGWGPWATIAPRLAGRNEKALMNKARKLAMTVPAAEKAHREYLRTRSSAL